MAEMDREIADLRALSDEVARTATKMGALRKRIEERRDRDSSDLS